MQSVIEFIFGKRNKDIKFLEFAYWFFVVFYFVALILLAIQPIGLINILLPAVLFPVMFRIVYGVLGLILRRFSTKKLLIVGGIFAFIMRNCSGMGKNTSTNKRVKCTPLKHL